MEHNLKKSIAAFSSVLWSAVLTALKLVVGIVTGSLGILSEALHSALDLLAALGTLFAVRFSAKPADADHPYGHGKVENLMALAETLLLLATAGWVVAEAISRLTSDDPTALRVEISLWAFIVIIISLVVDINRSAMLRRVARETNSAALEADAAHFSSDIWSSAAVLVGITGAALADQVTPGTTLHWLLVRADVLSSLAVAGIILHICKTLGMSSINNLMDKTDTEAYAKLSAAMAEYMPTYPLRHLRVRMVGNTAYVEMTVGMPHEMHVDTAHEIADAIEALAERTLPGAETLVHMQPVHMPAETPEMQVRRIALTHRLGVHSLRFLRAEQGYLVFADLELPPQATLESWSVAVQAFRSEVARRLGADFVYVHIEPDVRSLAASALPVPPDWEDMVRRSMIELGAPLPSTIRMFTSGAQRICFVCLPMEGMLHVEESHRRLSLLTKHLRETLPPVARIMGVYE